VADLKPVIAKPKPVKKMRLKKIMDDAISQSTNTQQQDDPKSKASQFQYVGRIASGSAGREEDDESNVVKLLVRKGADVCHCKHNGDSVLMACCKLGGIQSMKDILEVADAEKIQKVVVIIF
jgi:hypothetical protein